MPARMKTRIDVMLARVCLHCPVCKQARRQQCGTAFWFVTKIERGACPFCRLMSGSTVARRTNRWILPQNPLPKIYRHKPGPIRALTPAFQNVIKGTAMDVLMLSRIQFGATIAFHYIYPPLSIGLGVLLVCMEGLWLKTKNPVYHQMARFWTKVFALTFAIGVATGIVMEFEFGTNWATYSAARWRRKASSRFSWNPVFSPCCCSAGTR